MLSSLNSTLRLIIFNERRKCHTFTMKMLRFFYYLAGGIYAANEVPKKIKILWTGACITMLTLIIVVGMFGYLVTAEKIDVLAVYALLWCVDCVVNVIIIVPAITYRYHREFEALIEFIEQSSTGDSISRTATGYQYLAKGDSLSEVLFWLIIGFCAAFIFTMIGLVDMLFLCPNENSFRDLHHHLIGYPYMHLVPSLQVALLIYSVELITWMSGITVAISHVNFLMIIVTELNNIVVEYCQEIQSLAATIMPYERRLFELNLISLVRRHQRLVK